MAGCLIWCKFDASWKPDWLKPSNCFWVKKKDETFKIAQCRNQWRKFSQGKKITGNGGEEKG